MTNWNQLLAVLDKTLGFPNKQSSRVKKINQGFDPKTGEYVFWLEYRIKVNEGEAGKEQPQVKPQPAPKKKLIQDLLGMIKEK